MNLLVCEMAHVALADDEDAYKAGLLVAANFQDLSWL